MHLKKASGPQIAEISGMVAVEPYGYCGVRNELKGAKLCLHLGEECDNEVNTEIALSVLCMKA